MRAELAPAPGGTSHCAGRELARPAPSCPAGAGQAIEDAGALARYERVRLPRATRVQEASRGRTAHHHLPDGPGQQARDAAFVAEDPLSHNDWIYTYDAEQAALAAATQPEDGVDVR